MSRPRRQRNGLLLAALLLCAPAPGCATTMLMRGGWLRELPASSDPGIGKAFAFLIVAAPLAVAVAWDLVTLPIQISAGAPPFRARDERPGEPTGEWVDKWLDSQRD